MNSDNLTRSGANAASNDHDSRWELWAEDGLPTSIEQRLLAAGTHAADVATAVAQVADELTGLMERHHPVAAVDRFLSGVDSWEDRCDRWATLRTLERLSQLPVAAPAWPGWVPPDPHARRRPLTAIEMALVRHCSMVRTGRAAVVGALDSGAASGELTAINRTAVILGANGTPTGLRAAGTRRDTKSGYPEAAPRTLDLPAWCRPTYTRLLAGPTGDRPLAYGGRSDDQQKIQSCLLMDVGAALKDAGLAGDPTVKPLSIRNTYGRAVHDAGGGIEGAAAALGHDDLMSVAREIGIRPHKPARKR